MKTFFQYLENNQDSEYFQAIENKNYELLEKIVHQKALENGFIGPVWHGTPERRLHSKTRYNELKEIVKKYGQPKKQEIIQYIYDSVYKKYKFDKENVKPNINSLHKFKEYGFLNKEENDLFEKITNDYDFFKLIKDDLPKDIVNKINREFWWNFEKQKIGSSTESSDTKMGFFFTDKKPFACRFMHQIEYDSLTGSKKTSTGLQPECMKIYLKIQNPLDLRHISLQQAQLLSNILYMTPKEIRNSTRSSEGSKEIQKFLASHVSDLKSIGFDAVINWLKYENKRQTEFIVFEPNQIKSGEMITTDDGKEIIPLSKRFNSSNSDIRESFENNI